MKTKLCICTATILLALFYSFTPPLSVKHEKDLGPITPLIANMVMLYDTTKLLNGVKYANTSKDYVERYRTQLLTYPAFNLLKAGLEKKFNDPKALIYSDAEKETTLNLEERKKLPLLNDLKNLPVNCIIFFESWYYNKQTGEIVKKQLGYSVGKWDHEKEAFRELYLYFISKETKAIYVKNW